MFSDDIKKKIIDYCQDNVRVNWALSPIYLIVAFFVINQRLNLPLIHFGSPFNSILGVLLVSFGTYLYVSKFFQPDLDHPQRRPGMSIFPLFGSWYNFILKIKIPFLKKNIPVGSFLIFFLRPITFIWDTLWASFARFFTHRGAVHWPIWGLWLRVFWLMIFYYGAQFVILTTTGDVIKIPYFANWLNSFFPWDKGFESVFFYCFCFPVYLSDIFHSLGDLIGSKLSGLPFLGNMQQRGFIYKFTIGLKTKWLFVKRQVNKFKR